jgi:hypothetical protein
MTDETDYFRFADYSLGNAGSFFGLLFQNLHSSRIAAGSMQ